jgi:hypothetical protein
MTASLLMMYGKIKKKLKLLKQLEKTRIKLISKIADKVNTSSKLSGKFKHNNSIFNLVASTLSPSNTEQIKNAKVELDHLKQLILRIKNSSEHEILFWKWAEKSIEPIESPLLTSLDPGASEKEATGIGGEIMAEVKASTEMAHVLEDFTSHIFSASSSQFSNSAVFDSSYVSYLGSAAERLAERDMSNDDLITRRETDIICRNTSAKVNSEIIKSTAYADMLNYVCPEEEGNLASLLELRRVQHKEMLERASATTQKWSPYEFITISK